MTRPTNDENAPSRIGVLSRTTKASIAAENNPKNNAKVSSASLKPSTTTTTSTRLRTALAQQDKATLNTVAGKRKRDALGDATNGKAKNSAISKVTGLGGGTGSVASSTTTKGSTLQRASSVSTNVSNTTKENATASTRIRAPLGVKSRNTTAPAKEQKEKRAEPVKEVTTRRVLGSKTTQPASNAVSKTRKVAHATVHQEAKAPQVVRKVHAGKATATTKVVDVKVEEVDEDELRSRKRPRLSDEVEEKPLEEAKLANIKVEDVKEVLQIVTAKPEDGEPDDLDKDDLDDPLMVAEYAVEIFDYLRGLEVCSCRF